MVTYDFRNFNYHAGFRRLYTARQHSMLRQGQMCSHVSVMVEVTSKNSMQISEADSPF